jgi:hypothetical protein
MNGNTLFCILGTLFIAAVTIVTLTALNMTQQQPTNSLAQQLKYAKTVEIQSQLIKFYSRTDSTNTNH